MISDQRHDHRGTGGVGFGSALIAVLWIFCLVVGVIGFWNPGVFAAKTDATEPPAAPLDVQLSDAPPELDAAPPTPQTPADAPPPLADVPAAAPALPAISAPAPETAVVAAAPSAAIAFAVPNPNAVASRSTHRAAGPGGPAQIRHIVYGRGEGVQPRPQYPPEAVADREQGTVGLRFMVNPSGSVENVEVVSPSDWPLLNEAAARAVRDTWHFAPGNERIYEVNIVWHLNSL